MSLKSVLKEGAKEILTKKEKKRKGKEIKEKNGHTIHGKAMIRIKGTIDLESNLVGKMG